MSSLNSILETGKRALLVNQEAMATIGHNITNVNTEGYSRQRVNQSATLPIENLHYGQIGTGVELLSITRARDQLLDSQVRGENSVLGRWMKQDDALLEIQNLFLEPSDSGFSDMLSDFWDAWSDVANDPESTSARSVLVEKAGVLTNTLNGYDADLKSLEEKWNQEILQFVEDLNAKAEQVAKYNAEILRVEGSGQNANDLRDKRDLLLDEMSKIAYIKYVENEDGTVNVYLNGDIYVQNDQVTTLTTRSSARNGVVIDELFFQNFSREVEITGGELKGLLEARDTEAEDLRSKLDQFAQELVNKVNELHLTGYGLDGSTGYYFFDPETSGAGDIALNQLILNNLNIIAAGKTNAPGDNANALDIAALANLLTMNDGNETFNDYYAGVIADLGAKKQTAESYREQAEAVSTQLETTRQSKQGVVLDEELTDMIKYQQSYGAAAKIISVVNDLMNTLISLGQ